MSETCLQCHKSIGDMLVPVFHRMVTDVSVLIPETGETSINRTMEMVVCHTCMQERLPCVVHGYDQERGLL